MSRSKIANLPSGVGVSKSSNGRGREFWRVRLGKRFTGGPVVKKDFPTLATAKDWIFGDAQGKKTNCGSVIMLKQHAGSTAFEMAPALIAEAAAAIRTLGDTGTLTEAVRYFLKHAKPVGGIRTLQESIKELIKDRKAAGHGALHVNGLRCNLQRFAKDFPKARLHEIKRDQIVAWLDAQDFGTRTRRNYLRDLDVLFNFSIKREWIASIPTVGISKPALETGEIRILTPESTAEFLHAAQKIAPEIVGALAIKFFAGLRTSELLALDWSKVNSKQITIEAKTAKTRQRRVVTVADNLKEWLEKYGAQSGPVTTHFPAMWHRRLVAIEVAIDEERQRNVRTVEAGKFKLPQNCARHSFCSYHYAHHRNENLTAAEAGNSPKMIFSNYREMVQPEAAHAYWKIKPAFVEPVPDTAFSS